MPFNFMVAITVHSDFGAQENLLLFLFFPHLFAISDGEKNGIFHSFL